MDSMPNNSMLYKFNELYKSKFLEAVWRYDQVSFKDLEEIMKDNTKKSIFEIIFNKLKSMKNDGDVVIESPSRLYDLITRNDQLLPCDCCQGNLHFKKTITNSFTVPKLFSLELHKTQHVTECVCCCHSYKEKIAELFIESNKGYNDFIYESYDSGDY
jgi:hypothetical protein